MDFVYFNAFVVLTVVVYLLCRPARRSQSQFKLRKTYGQNKPSLVETENRDTPVQRRGDSQGGMSENPSAKTGFSGLFGIFRRKKQSTDERTIEPEERVLNVIFQFNGHDFDAHEVLGQPAGCSLKQAEAAYVQLSNTTDEDSAEFYKMAYDAIRRKS